VVFHGGHRPAYADAPRTVPGNGFPDDYKIERDYTGKVYGKSKQVARCGNAVPPPFATALVRANFPEWCGGIEIYTMAQLERLVAV
jgi:DNA (cytosine-5)-methyltransferase 1